MNEIEQIREEIAGIKERNRRVEGDKAWEKSGFRVAAICAATYLTASLLLSIIGIKEYFLSALIPTAGFFISTLSLPPIKKWWIQKYHHAKN